MFDFPNSLLWHTRIDFKTRKGRSVLSVDLQKASTWKRIAAWIFDLILLCVLATGVAFLLSVLSGYDGYSQKLEDFYAAYETQYGTTFDISLDQYNAMTEEEKSVYDQAYQALIADTEVVHVYNMVLNLSLLITTLGILFAMLILEFVVPLFLKNGQTIGKKIFAIGLVRTDSVQMNTMQLFVRAVLGKFTIETMIPVYIVLMLFWGTVNLFGLVILLALLLGQVICIGVTKTNSAIHDLLAGTVAVDLPSQKVFRSSQDLIDYTKRIHAERASHQDY